MVVARGTKTVRLSAEARAMLGIAAETVDGDELMQAMLRMPTDLLWNGGIGTYVKAQSETNAEVGDSVNDVRAGRTRATSARGSSARAATSVSRSARASSSRSRAAASTPTRSTTPPASTSPTTR